MRFCSAVIVLASTASASLALAQAPAPPTATMPPAPATAPPTAPAATAPVPASPPPGATAAPPSNGAAPPAPAAGPPAAPPPAVVYPPPQYDWPPRGERARSAALPEHAAVRSSPYLTLLIGGTVLNRRFATLFAPGVEVGMYFADRFRVALRGTVPLTEPEDEYSYDDDELDDFNGRGFINSDEVSFLFGGAVGVVAVDTPGFVLSPSIYVMRSDVGDYGTMVGLGLPFEWVSRRGLRIGFDFAFLRGFGGEVLSVCHGGTTCDMGEVRAHDRKAGNGFTSSFIIGWNLGQP